jgi:ATP-dependent RNA helicase DDX41
LQRYCRPELYDTDSSDDDHLPYVTLKERMKQTLSKLGRMNQLKEDERNKAKSSSECERENEEEEDGQVWGRKSNISLLDQHTELKKMAEGMKYLFNNFNF